MELKKTPTIILLLVTIAIVIGVGMIVLDKLQQSVTLATTSATDSFTANTSLDHTFTNRPIVAVSSVFNGTSATQTLTLTTEYTISGNVFTLVNTSYNNSLVNATYTYSANTTASDDLVSAVSAIGDFSSDWMAVIVVVVAAAIILGMVIAAFGYRR